MTTTSHTPNEGNVLPAGVPRRQSLTNAESESGNFLGSQPLLVKLAASLPVAKRLGVSASYSLGLEEVITSSATREEL
jgi:hypothetical protein